MRLSDEDKDAKIVELYQKGWSYRQLQKRYHRSPNYIARLIKGIEVTCAACGKLKGKVRFHAHHPDRENSPDLTIPLCPSCHPKEEAKLRQLKESKPQSSPSTALQPTENMTSEPGTASLSAPFISLSPIQKNILTVLSIAAVIETLSPGFINRRWQEIKDHWQRSQ